MKFAIVLILAVAATDLSSVNAGFAGLNCPSTRKGKALMKCDADCKEEHGSFGGICRDPAFLDFNCYCGPPSLLVPINKKAQICKTPSIESSENCSIDCRCNHAAVAGYCDFERKTCICYGEDSSNSACPIRTAQEFADYYSEQIGTIKIAKELLDES